MKKTIDLVPLDQIVPNPWRDLKLNPLDSEHVNSLRDSMIHSSAEWFGSLVGRRGDDGKIEIAYGHARLAAARKAKLDTIPIEIRDLDDDAMLEMMTHENAYQQGSQPGAVMNEVSAVTQRLIEGLMPGADNCPPLVAKAFGSKKAIAEAHTKLLRGKDAHLALGYTVIRAFLGNGDPERSPRGERAIREAISALKQSALYDEMVDDAVRKHSKPVADKPLAKTRDLEPSKAKPRERILDERTATVFKNDHQFHAFRDAVTSPSAKRVIPVENQYKLAKRIMRQDDEDTSKIRKNPDQIGAPYITKMVQAEVQDGIKQQREINEEEKEQYRMEQVSEMIDKELYSINSNYRAMLSGLMKLERLARAYPGHPKITGFIERLERLSDAINQFIKEANNKRKVA